MTIPKTIQRKLLHQLTEEIQMYATYKTEFYGNGTQKRNRPLSVHRTLYGAQQAAKHKRLSVGWLIPEKTCYSHRGVTPGQYLLSGACQGEPENYCRPAEVAPIK